MVSVFYSPGRYGALGILLFLALVTMGAGCKDIVAIGGKGEPELLWRTEHLARFRTSDETPATDGDRLYAIAGGLVAYDARTGAIVWTKGFQQTLPRNVLVRSGRVFAVEAVAWALDPASGRELWRFTPDSHSGFGESTADERAFYFGTDSHRVYALDQATGALLWTTDVGPDWKYRGTIKGAAVSGDTLYVTAEQYNAENGYIATGWIFALDRASGRVLWSYRNGTGTDWRNISSSPTVEGRLLLASDLKGGSFFAVDRFTGQEVWRVTGPLDKFGPNQAPVVVGETAYVASNDTYVYAVELATGRVRWKTKTPASNHALAVCGNRIFVDWLGLSVLDRQGGRTLHQSREGAEEYATSGFAVHEDRVFVLGNRAAYAYRCS